MLLLDPREFLYVKQVQRSGCRYVEASKSVEMASLQSKASTVRGDLLVSGNVIEELSGGELRFTGYSESNMKIKVSPTMTKKLSANEIRKGKQRMEKYF